MYWMYTYQSSHIKRDDLTYKYWQWDIPEWFSIPTFDLQYLCDKVSEYNKPSHLTVLVIRKKENLIIEKIPKNRIRIVKGSSCFIRIFLEFKRPTMKSFLTKLSTEVCKYRVLNLQPVNFTLDFFPGIFRHCLDLLLYRTLEVSDFRSFFKYKFNIRKITFDKVTLLVA